jgi:hypothetical protein
MVHCELIWQAKYQIAVQSLNPTCKVFRPIYLKGPNWACHASQSCISRREDENSCCELESIRVSFNSGNQCAHPGRHLRKDDFLPTRGTAAGNLPLSPPPTSIKCIICIPRPPSANSWADICTLAF